MTCPTPPARSRPAMLPVDPRERLAVFEQALFELASGKQRVQVRQGDNWVQYGLGSVAYLEREVARLRAICGKREGITIGRSYGRCP